MSKALALTQLRAVICALLCGLTGPVFAHGGALNVCGCHFNRRTGDCHCHRPRGCGCACEPAGCGNPLEGPELNEQLPAPECGKERWAVKTLADPEAEKVKINSPEATTIEGLRALPAPAYAAANPRSSLEKSVYTVDGLLVGYTLAADSDFHAVIQNAAKETLIIEFPNPGCLQGSKVISLAIAARTRFLQLIGTVPTSHFVSLTKAIRVRVTGVVFFDRIHGQDGVAPNGVELHPVIGLEGLEVSPGDTLLINQVR